MKLKEKLAEEDCCRLHTGNFSSDSSTTTKRVEDSFKQGYLAGFEKARAIAAAGFKLQGSKAALAMYEHLMSMGEEEM